MTRTRLWPPWHPLITGKPRALPLTSATREQLGIEFDYVFRRAAFARRHDRRLP